jgi:predicted Rossmann fold nucleotide-binding protein DprA/Smf involved in DNA uptake
MARATLTDTAIDYPSRLQERLGDDAPPLLTILGNLDLLALWKVALFCSARCPGHVILAAHDQAARWRDEGRCVISGFHSPVEKECLSILLRGNQPIIICPARGVESMRAPSHWKPPLRDNRLLVLSAFQRSERRVTKSLAVNRNRLVAALADEVVFAHIAPGGHLDELRQAVAFWGVPNRVLTEMSAPR